MKKQYCFAALLLVLVMTLSACGGAKDPTQTQAADPSASASAGTSAVPSASITSSEAPAQDRTEEVPASTAAAPSSSAAVPETPAESREEQTTAVPETPEATKEEAPTTEVPPESAGDPTVVSEDFWDGTSQIRRLDEAGRTVKVENFYPDGSLHFRKEFSYGFGTEIVSEEFYEEWDKSGALSYSYRYENYPDGSTKTSWLKYNDGTSNKSYYDEKHHDIGYETWYADGSPRSRTQKEYYPDSDVIASDVSEEWDESGRLTYASNYSYFENGFVDRAEQLFEDGHRSVRLSDSDGKLLKTSETYPGGQQLRYERTYEYGENDRVLHDVQQEWAEDGSLLALGDCTYYPDGSVKLSTSIFRWKNDTRYTYEYDEAGREIRYEAESLDGRYHCEAVRTYTAEGYVINTSSLENGETWQEVVRCDTEDRTVDHLWIREDGSTEYYLYDGQERIVAEEYKNADGLVTRTEKYEFFSEDSRQHSYSYEAVWEEENNGYYIVEDWYHEDGWIWKDAIVYPDGSRFSSEANANGNTTVSDYWYPNGVHQSHSEHEYYEDTGWRASYSEQSWNEDGSHDYLSQETYYPNGWTKTSYYVASDTAIYHSEFDEFGNRTLYETGMHDVITYRKTEVFSEDGDAKTFASEEYFNDDGSFGCRLEWTLYPNGQTAIFSRIYDYGTETYREFYEDGRTKLNQEFFTDGSKSYEDIVSEDGSEDATYWHENGQVRTHLMWNADGEQILSETFQEDGSRINLEIRRPDGTRTARRYDGEGRVRYEDDYTEDIYYDRRFAEGRMFLERRTRRSDNAYLGCTEWEYFEEGGVKKIRISENNEYSIMISQTVVPDDGKIGYPEELDVPTSP